MHSEKQPLRAVDTNNEGDYSLPSQKDYAIKAWIQQSVFMGI